jgi:hypothetical protein
MQNHAAIQDGNPAVPAFIQDAIARTIQARKDFAHVQPADADVGQLWRLQLPVPLWDKIDPEHQLGSVEPMVFIAAKGTKNDPDFGDEEYYAFLCLGKSALETFPVLDGELKRWHHAPYAWWTDIKTSTGSVPPTAAEFVLPTHPVYVRREWLVACEGDLGGMEAKRRVLDQFTKWIEYSDSPWLMEDHPRNQIGGHTLMEVLEHVKACWIQHKLA